MLMTLFQPYESRVKKIAERKEINEEKKTKNMRWKNQ